MKDYSALCFSCMGLLDENGKCPHCGDTLLPRQDHPLLPLGTMINGRYYIGKVIRTNGEGSTYVAYDTRLSRPCTLREFYPSAIAERDDDGITLLVYDGSQSAYTVCLDSFFKLWTKLMRLKGLTALISVYDVFKTNGTAYAVYSDSEEVTLRSYLLSNGQGFISWEQARILFMPVLSTLVTLHTSGIIHKGISPSSFIVSPDGRLKLSDFCTSEVKTAYGELEADITDGYAPPEVYSERGKIGTWTDIYSFTAVLFRTLVGSTPISAPIRAKNDQMMIPAKFAEQLPPYVINALINGMQLDAEDRTRNAEQLRSNLSASPRAIGASAAVFSSNTASLNAQTAQQKAQQQEPLKTTPRPEPGQAKPAYIEKLSPERVVLAQKAELEANKKNSAHRRLMIFLIAMLVGLLIGIGLVLSEIINNKADNNTTATAAQSTQTDEISVVPNFVGKTYDDVANDSYYSAMFSFAMATQADDTIPRGEIIAQSIAPSTTVTTGTLITLTVSTGAASFSLPDVTGLTYEEALAQLAAKGLVCTKGAKYNDGTHASDTVAETVPEAKTQVKSGDTVYIVLWSTLDEQQSTALTETSEQNTATTVTP